MAKNILIILFLLALLNKIYCEKKQQQDNINEHIVVLNEGNINEILLKSNEIWFVSFSARCGAFCTQFDDSFKDAAKRIKGVRFGLVQAEDNQKLIKDYGINEYPNMQIFPKLKKDRFYRHEGDSSLSTFRQVMNYEVQRANPPQQLLNSSIYDEFCNKITCLISFLPHIYDSSAVERNRYFDRIKDIHHLNRYKPLNFLWSQGGDQENLEQKLNLEIGYPQLVAINGRKQVYTVLRGSYNEKRIQQFIKSFFEGKEAIQKITSEPIIKTIEPWDGLDKKQTLGDEEYL